MNNNSKSNESEFRVIEILDQNNNMTQRRIANKAGISLGLTNIIIKRLVKKGFIKIKNMNKRRILYHLTPKAIVEKTYRTYNYFERTVKDVVRIRERIQQEILNRNRDGLGRIVILGDNEIGEIARWAIQELRMKSILIKNLEKKTKIDLNKCLIVNCNTNNIKKSNYINVFKIL